MLTLEAQTLIDGGVAANLDDSDALHGFAARVEHFTKLSQQTHHSAEEILTHDDDDDDDGDDRLPYRGSHPRHLRDVRSSLARAGSDNKVTAAQLDAEIAQCVGFATNALLEIKRRSPSVFEASPATCINGRSSSSVGHDAGLGPATPAARFTSCAASPSPLRCKFDDVAANADCDRLSTALHAVSPQRFQLAFTH